MRQNRSENARLAVLAPTLSRARKAAASLRLEGRDEKFTAWALDRFLDSGTDASRVVLCPAGDAVATDVAFLETARSRLLWPAPSPPLSAAIAGLLGGSPAETEGSAPPSHAPALLLEGRVTRQRAERALAGDARTWIVDRATCVRLSGDELRRLSAAGVRWAALAPVRVVAVAATPALARARGRWRNLLPRGTRVWILDR
jgi:hypothetical protein